jgi:enoyl-CoA hydratase/carnithine racemase
MSASIQSLKTESAAEPVLLRHDGGGICTLTLNRPKQYNALSEELLAALQEAFDEIAADKSVRVVILAGAGKAFCAGHDLKQMRANPRQAYYEWLFKTCSRVMVAMTRLPQPVIARVHGIATAAGCQLVANCDLAVAVEDAKFGTSGINAGLFCTTPGVALSRNVHRKHALEMLLTGDIIPAEQALAFGLINRVVPAAQLDDAIAELAGKILNKSAAAVATGKRAFYKQVEMGLLSAYDFASEEMARNMGFRDAGEGIDAFIEKRKPDWRHE